MVQLPQDMPRVCVNEYEHIDLIWGETAHEVVFPKVLAFLQGAHEECLALCKSSPTSASDSLVAVSRKGSSGDLSGLLD